MSVTPAEFKKLSARVAVLEELIAELEANAGKKKKVKREKDPNKAGRKSAFIYYSVVTNESLVAKGKAKRTAKEHGVEWGKLSQAKKDDFKAKADEEFKQLQASRGDLSKPTADASDSESEAEVKPAKGKGKPAAKAAPAKGKGKATPAASSDSDSDSESAKPTPAKGKGKPAAKAAPAKGKGKGKAAEPLSSDDESS
jgi:hypothetical protein